MSRKSAGPGSRFGRMAMQIGVPIASLMVLPSQAVEIDTGNADVQLRWDNTFKYSGAYRLSDPSGTLVDDNVPANINNLNLDDGDRNFKRGPISNRVDVLSEMDVSFKKKFGARVSAAAWYDTVYNRRNDNDAPDRVNQVSEPYNEFTDATRKLHGRKAEFLDAFLYATGDAGNLRLGRHSLLYGETLFFGGNGVAYAQSPTDVVKLLSVPNSQFKEITIPVNQVSGQYQFSEQISVGAYYQFEFRKSRIPGVGSYFSGADVFDDGAERFLFAPGVGVPRVADEKAKSSGQGGLQLRWRPKGSDVEYGFYAVRYHDKAFQAYLRPVAGNFQLVYPENIKSYGASFSTEVAGFNVAGEVSVRRNTPLVSGPVVDLSATGVADNNRNAGYAIGNSLHANLSGIFFLNRSAIWDNASLLAEIAWNRRTSITRNAAELDPNTSRDAWGLRAVIEPQWFQVAPSLDLSLPIGLGYNPKGNSSVVQVFNGGVKRGGDFSIGIKGVYDQVWRAGLNYTHYIGSAGAALGADANLTFKQSNADRDFVSLSVQRTF